MDNVVHENVVGGSSMIGFPLVIAFSERDMPGIEPGPLGWHTSTLTNELQEVRQKGWPGNSGVPPTIALLKLVIRTLTQMSQVHIPS